MEIKRRRLLFLRGYSVTCGQCDTKRSIERMLPHPGTNAYYCSVHHPVSGEEQVIEHLQTGEVLVAPKGKPPTGWRTVRRGKTLQ